MSRVTRALIVATTLIVAVAIGIADVSTGYLPEITIFILVPVIAGTYYFGFKFGFLVAIIAASSELVAHLILETDGRHAEIIVSTISHTFIYILTAALIAMLVKQLDTISGLEEQRSNDLAMEKQGKATVNAPTNGRNGTVVIGCKLAITGVQGGGKSKSEGHSAVRRQWHWR